MLKNFRNMFKVVDLRNKVIFTLAVIVVLWGLIVATIDRLRRVSGLAALLLLPYLAWVSFATALNATIWWQNR